jgi:hypothetical protein
MRYWNTYHTFYDTFLPETYDPIVINIEKYFEDKSYSIELDELETIINCSPGWDFKQRSSFSRKQKTLFFDIIIDYDYYMSLADEARKNCLALSFLRDIEILKKFKPKDFKFEELKQDFKSFFKEIGWLYSEDI